MEELKQIIELVVANKSILLPAIGTLIYSVIGVATQISKLTPGETDNKWVGYLTKVSQLFALHATPTKVIKK